MILKNTLHAVAAAAVEGTRGAFKHTACTHHHLEVEDIEARELRHVCSRCLHRSEGVSAKACHSRWAHDPGKISDQTFRSLKIDDLDLLQSQKHIKREKTRTAARKRTQCQSAAGSNDVDVYRAAKEKTNKHQRVKPATQRKGGLAYLLLVTKADGSKETC